MSSTPISLRRTAPTPQPVTTTSTSDYTISINGTSVNSSNISWVSNVTMAAPSTSNIYFGKLPSFYNSNISSINPCSNVLIGDFVVLNKNHEYDSWDNTGSDFYNKGPPTECLSVGGDAVIEQKLGVGETSPTQLIHARGTGPQLFIEGATNENAVIRGSAGPSYRDKYHEISMGFYALAGSGSINYIDFKVNDGGQSNSPGTRMRIRGDGNVGIGTTNPYQARLVVSGVGSSFTMAYSYLSYYGVGNTGGNQSPVNFSIYADQPIAAPVVAAFSDSRIKKNVTDINDSSALEKIRLLEPKIYNYIDEKQRGTSNVYGFIAQEVANVLPYAVTVGHGDIPNILTNSNVIVTENSNVIELHLDTTVEGLTLSNTSNINITTDNNQYLTVPVLSFSGSNVITIENRKEFSNVTGAYIHGEHVLDFHNLNKDAIWSVATAALQEVDRQLQAEKTKVATLETQVADLLARVTALENN